MRLILRTCKADGTSYHDFKWPSEVGALVEAPDWDPSPCCGGGLHGYLWGEGHGQQLRQEDDAIWQVVEVPDDDEIVHITEYDAADLKMKFCRGSMAFSGSRDDAIAYVAERAPGKAVYGAKVIVGLRGTATAGDSGIATAGDSGAATAGDRGEIRIRYWHQDSDRYRCAIGYVGESEIESGAKYRCTEAGVLVPVEDEK